MVWRMTGLPVTSSFGPNSRSTAMPSLMSRFGALSSTRRISLAYSCLSVWARRAHTAGPCAAPVLSSIHAHVCCHAQRLHLGKPITEQCGAVHRTAKPREEQADEVHAKCCRRGALCMLR